MGGGGGGGIPNPFAGGDSGSIPNPFSAQGPSELMPGQKMPTFSSISNGLSGIGGGLAAANPFRAPDWQKAGTPWDPGKVSGPGQAQTYSAAMMGMGMDDFKQAQLKTINNLQGIANGTAASPAMQAMQQQTDANINSQMAMANSARGGFNPALARAAMQQGATANQSLASQAASTRMQEQLQAAQTLGNIAGQGRQGDINIAANNQMASNQQSQQFAELQAKYAAMGIDAKKANQLAQLDLMKIQNGAIASNNATSLAAQGAQKSGIMGMFGNLGQGAAQLGTLFGGGAAGAAGAGASAGGDLADIGDIASTV